jgi:hypothetical protein
MRPNAELWWNGPKWLSKDSEEWPVPKVKTQILDDTPEKRRVTLATAKGSVNSPNFLTFKNFSSMLKLQRAVAHCLRFAHNCKNPANKRTGSISIFELRTAHSAIIKNVQTETFSEEIRELSKGNSLKHNKLTSLDPVIGPDGLLRVGGRLKNAPLAYDIKHPILLPNKHHVTNLIITQMHQQLLHAGPQSTLYNLRQRYWVINGRNEVRKVTGKCLKCFKINPKPSTQKMGDLPVQRVEPLRPFLRTGVDYGGPILIKQGNRKSKKIVKPYIALFICLNTKAIHLELVSDLTSDAFLAAFNRFISRRGNVSEMFSDNGTNFVGANNHLKDLGKVLMSNEFDQNVIHGLINKKIAWHFIPPKTPHMGGLWEAGIKTVKIHIKKVCALRQCNAHF